MRKITLIIATLLCVLAFADDRTKEQKKEDKKLTKALVGQWVNPYTYESTGELKGYDFKKKGKCEAINIPSWDFESFEVKKGWIHIKGREKNESGEWVDYYAQEKIDKLNKDTLTILVSVEPKMVFLYVNPEILEEK